MPKKVFIAFFIIIVAQKVAKKKGSSMTGYYVVFAVLGGLTLYVIVMLFLNRTPPLTKTPTIDDKRIDEHNSNFPWKQGANKFFEGTTLAEAKKIVTSSFSSHSNLPRCNTDETIIAPENFDARSQWADCVSPVANQQKTCGSSYAIGLAQTFAERACIASTKPKLVTLSAQDLLSCDYTNQGCKGGYLNLGLEHLKTKGIVEESCFPYEADSDTVKCEKKCKDGAKHRIENSCLLIGEEDIKRDVFRNGPVVTVTHIHVDFLTYKSGIYRKGDEVPRFSGFQTVKIVGWGTETGEGESNKGERYWIVQNTWGDDWGENGYAKIAMGQEMMFDQYAYSIRVRSDRAPSSEQRTQDSAKTQDNTQNKASTEEANTENVDLDDLKLDEEKPADETNEKEKRKTEA